MPVFVRGKYSLLKSRITPYVLLDAGYDPLFVSVNHEISDRMYRRTATCGYMVLAEVSIFGPNWVSRCVCAAAKA